MNTPNIATPITDAEAGYEDGSGCWKYRPNGAYAPADLARQLERDRARLMEALKLCQASLQKLSFADAEIVAARESAYRALASLEIKDDK